MKLIVGLGNPGEEYRHTRHNVGFAVVEHLLQSQEATWSEDAKHHAKTAKVTIGNETILLVKPMTFMNASGDAVQSLLTYYKVNPLKDLLVIQDEMDLPAGRLAFMAEGGPAGHNGIADIQERIGKVFARLRIGIGRPTPPLTKESWVLSRPQGEEEALLKTAIERAEQAAKTWMTDGLEKAMNEWNRVVS